MVSLKMCSASRSIGALPAACARAQLASRRYAGTLATFKIPEVNNEPNASSRFFEVDSHTLTKRSSNITAKVPWTARSFRMRWQL